MERYNKIFFGILLGGFVLLGTLAFAAPIATTLRSILPELDSRYFLGTTTPSTIAWKGLIVDEICLAGDCQTTWSSGAGDITGGQTIGTGVNIFDKESSGILYFNTLSAGTNVTFSTSTDANTIVISSSGSGSSVKNPFDVTTIGGTPHQASSTNPFYFGKGLLAASSTLGYLNVGYIDATSTTATSTFAGGFKVGTSTSNFMVDAFTGRVGIGTAAPGYALSVSGGSINLDVNQPLRSGGNYLIGQVTGNIIQIGSTVVANDFLFNSTSGGIVSIKSAGNVGIGETAPGSKLSVSGGGTFGAGYDTTAATTNGLLVEGNVGIGTTSPYSLLSISNSASTAANTPLFTIASTTAGTATSTLMTVLANGNVGIGTASPTSKLQVTDIGNTYISLNSTANTPEVALSMNTNTDSSNLWWTGINDDSAKNYSITYGPAITLAGIKFLITTTGNVGIGTSTPGQKLSVAGDILGNNIIGSYFTGTSTATSTFAGGASIAGLATTKGLTITGGSLNLNATNYTVLDGNGLISTSGTLAVGAGTCITVNANDVAVTSNCTDAATVDSIEGASLLRSNASDNYTSGTLTFDAATTLSIAGTLNYTNSATSSFKGGILTSQGFSGFFGSFRNLELGDGTASSTLKFDTSDGGQITIATSTSGRDVVLGATVKTFWGVSIASTTIDLGAGFGRANAIIPIPAKHYGYSISHIQCSTWGGTNVVVDLGPDNSAGSNDITCTPTSTTTRQRITGSNVFTFGQGGFLRIISQSGTNNWVFITAVGTTTPQ